MFWRKIVDNRVKFVAVMEMEEIVEGRQMYGKSTYRLKLADGTTVERIFQLEEWRTLNQPPANGGVVVGGDPL